MSASTGDRAAPAAWRRVREPGGRPSEETDARSRALGVRARARLRGLYAILAVGAGPVSAGAVERPPDATALPERVAGRSLEGRGDEERKSVVEFRRVLFRSGMAQGPGAWREALRGERREVTGSRRAGAGAAPWPIRDPRRGRGDRLGGRGRAPPRRDGASGARRGALPGGAGQRPHEKRDRSVSFAPRASGALFAGGARGVRAAAREPRDLRSRAGRGPRRRPPGHGAGKVDLDPVPGSLDGQDPPRHL